MANAGMELALVPRSDPARTLAGLRYSGVAVVASVAVTDVVPETAAPKLVVFGGAARRV